MVVKSKFVPVLKLVPCHGNVWGIGGRTPRILNVDGGKWCQLCALTALSLGKSPLYPLDRRLGRPQSRSRGCCEEKINPFPARAGNQIPVVQPVPIPVSTAGNYKFNSGMTSSSMRFIQMSWKFVNMFKRYREETDKWTEKSKHCDTIREGILKAKRNAWILAIHILHMVFTLHSLCSSLK